MSHTLAAPTLPSVLIADDDEYVRAAVGEVLSQAGYNIETAADGEAAALMAIDKDFDCIVSDIGMPGMDGMTLLRTLREAKPDLPVILLTGDPSLETAMEAVKYGARRYIVKPFKKVDLQEVVARAVRIHRRSRLQRQAREMLASVELPDDKPGDLSLSFDRALKGLEMAFQPIVCWSKRNILGFEALVRSQEPKLPNPGVLFAAAEELQRLPEIGRVIRRRIFERSSEAPDGVSLFVNLHPQDLLDDELYEKTDPLEAISSRVVLEITERASLHEIADIDDRIISLRERGFQIAVDDLGAGYAGLSSLAQMDPDIVKLDMTLIRDINEIPLKQKLVRSMVTLCRELDQLVIAEGIETVEERDTLIELGCDYFQGFLFARPLRNFADADFS